MSLATVISPRPALDDRRQFERRPGVPVLDEHARHGRTVDADLLALIARNTNDRARMGEYPLILIGHTSDTLPESEQPEVVGFASDFRLGRLEGRACIVADFSFMRDKLSKALKYPRRSVEVFYSNEPSENYIDAISLLVRSSARPLGLLSYGKDRSGLTKERYSITPTQPNEASMATAFATLDRQNKDFRSKLDRLGRRIDSVTRETHVNQRRPVLERLAKTHELDLAEELEAVAGMDEARWGRHVARIKARYRKVTPPVPVSPDGLEPEDISKLVKYCKQRNVNPATDPHGFVLARDAFVAEKRAGRS